jgi:hypothetical protein
MQIWLIVGVLFAGLLALHGRYLYRDYQFLQQLWQELDHALQKRHHALQAMLESAPQLEPAIGTDLRLLLQRETDRHPKRWLQRSALETRLSLRAEQAFRQLDIAPNITRSLDRLDDAIQLSLRLYQIGANRYNHRREAFPGNLLAVLTAMPTAPHIEVDSVHLPLD